MFMRIAGLFLLSTHLSDDSLLSPVRGVLMFCRVFNRLVFYCFWWCFCLGFVDSWSDDCNTNATYDGV